jgi:dienelactone hydrolase
MKFTSLLFTCIFSAANVYGQISISTDSITHISSVWYYPNAGRNPETLISDTSKELPHGLKLSVDRIITLSNGNPSAYLFTPDKTKVLFYVREKMEERPRKNGVEVWSYTDAKTGDWEKRDENVSRLYAMSYDLKTKRLIRLEGDNEKLAAVYDFGINDISSVQISNDFIVLYKFHSDFFTYNENGVIVPFYSFSEYEWNKKLSCDAYLVSLEDGKRTLIKSNVNPVFADLPYFRLSPSGKFVVYYDGERKAYFCFDILKGSSKEIAGSDQTLWRDGENLAQPEVGRYEIPKGISGWMKHDSAVFIQDINDDTWQVDLVGNESPIRLSDASPVKEVKQQNAMGIKRELVRWKSFDGQTLEGILRKPKDFDPAKKYPLIVVFYEHRVISIDDLTPYGTGDFVDYGYLVFSPDVPHKIGETGQSAYNSIVSAIEYLSSKPFVDSKRIGIRGGSFAGYQTNYLITHTNLFAAAISQAGYSDFISNNGVEDVGVRPHTTSDVGQNRLGASLWERPDIWIKNSPVFYANNVTTPVLIMHSRDDDNVPFEQSVEFFKALRRLGKKAWLIQYDGMGHIGANNSSIGNQKRCKDFCVRQLQFFNHYLKGEPAPKWMLDEMPASVKASERGLELDSTGRAPSAGLVKEKQTLTQPQFDLLKHKTMVTLDGRIIDVGEKKPQKK